MSNRDLAKVLSAALRSVSDQLWKQRHGYDELDPETAYRAAMNSVSEALERVAYEVEQAALSQGEQA